MAKFTQFDLQADLLSTITSLGYIDLTPIQEVVIPPALRGTSLIARSPTGSGKTHAFLVPIFNKINRNNSEIQAIILSPTRELAKQTADFARLIAKDFPEIRILLLAGGEEKSRNISALSKKPHIVIATPGRLKDLGLENTVTSLMSAKTIVLDEADMLLDSGFFPVIDEILKTLVAPQIMVFSATIPASLINLMAKYFKDVSVLETGSSATSTQVEHFLIDSRHQDSHQLVYDFIKWKQPYFLLVFASTKQEVSTLYKFLLAKGIKVGIIHGDLPTRERKTMMKRINNDDFPVVVASDMAARGLDFTNVSEVLNVNLPNNLEYYFHRAGRTGRYQDKGEVYTIYDSDNLAKPRKLIEQKVNFSFLFYQDGSFTDDKRPRLVEREKPRFKKTSELDVEIQKTVAKTRSKKIKPNYKKKVQQAVAKTKQKHRREVIRKDIRRQQEERYRSKAKNSDE